ncbi:hypothetical protein FE840_013895 [Peteryoungia desertarenae]|uniref:Uncharacterized protein n=1 Tax=Peteryoungia desertarenae TaxID=1813451 RepID=A0ABX6QPK1_9HYPH|nr:hypothetical protein [Peteryoungia desertarenae]QLF70538.1 hypothetical protein FE840_013895 [Peteryoungia desertarenae]
MPARQTPTSDTRPRPPSPRPAAKTRPKADLKSAEKKARKTRAQSDPAMESGMELLLRSLIRHNGGPPNCASADCRRHRRCMKPMRRVTGRTASSSQETYSVPPCIGTMRFSDIAAVHQELETPLRNLANSPLVPVHEWEIEDAGEFSANVDVIVDYLCAIVDRDDPFCGGDLRAWKALRRKARLVLKKRMAEEALRKEAAIAITGDEV